MPFAKGLKMPQMARKRPDKPRAAGIVTSGELQYIP